MLAIVDADVFVHWAARASDDADEAVEMAEELIDSALESTFSDSHKFAVKGKGNFRKEVSEDYKAHRPDLDDDLRTKLNAVHKLLIKKYNAVPANDMEADDLVRIWAEEAIKAKEDFVIIAEDKDLKCIPGIFYNPKKNFMEYINEGEADLLYHCQLLTGDSADNIKGLYRVGPKTARKWLVDVPMSQRMDKVKEIWAEKHPQDWQQRLLTCGRLIHILRTHDDEFTLGENIDAGKEETVES